MKRLRGTGVKQLKARQPLKQGAPIKSRQLLKAKLPLKKDLKLTSGTSLRLKPSKPKVKSISQLKKLADKYHSLATRYRFAEQMDSGAWVAPCITCSVIKNIKELQCGHFMGRAHNAVRYSEYNTAPQCYGCNVMQQGRQFIFGMEIDKLYGEGTAHRLYKESREPHQFKRDELLQVIHDAKEYCEFYETQLST